MIRCLLWMEVDPDPIFNDPNGQAVQILTAAAGIEAEKHGYRVVDQETTISLDGTKKVLVWNLEEK